MNERPCMIHSIFHQVYVSDLSVIITAMLILPIAWSVFGALFYKRMRLIGTILLIITLAVILYMTVFARGESSAGHDFTPFSSFQRAIEQPEMYRSMLMNIFLFEPLGLALPFVMKGSTAKRILLTIAIGFILSVAIEALQYFFTLGLSEADDAICNTVGTALGSCAYLLTLLWRKLIKKNRGRRKA